MCLLSATNISRGEARDGIRAANSDGVLMVIEDHFTFLKGRRAAPGHLYYSAYSAYHQSVILSAYLRSYHLSMSVLSFQVGMGCS